MKAQNIIAGLVILSKYGRSDYHIVAKHDCIWAGPDNAGELDVEDMELLRHLGWLWDESVDRWLATV